MEYSTFSKLTAGVTASGLGYPNCCPHAARKRLDCPHMNPLKGHALRPLRVVVKIKHRQFVLDFPIPSWADSYDRSKRLMLKKKKKRFDFVIEQYFFYILLPISV